MLILISLSRCYGQAERLQEERLQAERLHWGGLIYDRFIISAVHAVARMLRQAEVLEVGLEMDS